MGLSVKGDEPSDEQRYGPELEQYLRAGYFDLSLREPPTHEEALEAIKALRNDLDVTYEDFETILAMEKSPACSSLYNLLSTPDDNFIGIFPACINLLQAYCSAEGNGILDHAYGFLCLRVMSLVVQLAMLAHNVDQNWFESFWLTVAQLPEDQSVYSTLSEHMNRLYDWAKELDPNKKDITLFGICYNPESRKVVCLPHTGECDTPAAEFIIEKLWSARDKFLFAARWATHLFPRMGIMLDMIRALFAAPRLNASVPLSTRTISDDDQIWVRLLDVVTRYSLCCDESEESRTALMLRKFPKVAQDTFSRSSSIRPVNELDATQVVVDASNRLKARLDAPMSLSLHAFLYGCGLLTSNSAESLGRTIFDAYFDKMWFELCRYNKSTENQLHALLHSCTSMTHAYILIIGKHQERAMFFLDFLSDKIAEVHARMILLPILTQTLGTSIASMNIYQDQFRTWTSQLTMGLIHSRVKVPVGLTDGLFPMWHRIFEHLQFSESMMDSSTQMLEQKYFHSWVTSWVRLGLMYEMGDILRHPMLCSYPRCPAPSIMVGWKCGGCNDRLYCTRQCQRA
ncbi:unnamed protein product [Rhizoctonia solani]|uniref:MYND-type domain-containing protein n=1 Tax=Rhizoctonia solani TaxID=456999 RepID=A0A8H3E6V9_9AGAM|nr:unnamed protein product [Rhizoctonia solani]